MERNRKRTLAGIVAVGAIALALSGAVLYPSISQAADETPAAPTTPSGQARFFGSPDGRGADDTALAEALGITEEELTTARETAATAAIDQAVEEGLLTEAQGTQLKQRGLGARGFGPLGMFVEGAIDADALLAEALGVTTEELDAARETVQKDALAAAVEAGNLTQEEADLILARQAVQEYLTPRLESAYSEALAEAVSAGAITQEQADALTEQGWGTRGFGGGHDLLGFGHGGRGRGGHGDMMGGGRHGGMERGGRGFDFPDGSATPDSTTPVTPEEGTDSNG